MVNKKNFEKKFILFNGKKYNLKKKSCEICKNSKNKIFQNIGKIGNKPGAYGYLPISICENCGHKFLSPRYSNAYYKEFYLKEYGKIPFKKIKPSKKYLALQKIRGQNVFSFFSKKVKKTKKGKILDHGSATGLALMPWKNNGWSCYGIEPHKESVKYANSIGLNVKNGYGENLSFKSNFFDVVISLGSFEHAYDINKTFKQFNRVLKRNGKLILRWRSDKIKGSPLEYFNHITYRYFTKNSLYNLLNKHRFKIENFIDKKIEGYDTFEYIIAKKNHKEKKKIKKDNVNKILSFIKKKHENYSNIALKAKRSRGTKNLNRKKRFIKKNKIGLMNIGKIKAINRVFKEMNFYLKTDKKFNLINV